MHRLPRALTLRQHPLLRHITPPQRIRPIQRIRPMRPVQQRYQSQYIHTNHLGEPIRLQSVRFKRRPFFTWRTLATITLYSGVVYLTTNLLLRYIDIEIEFTDGDDAEQTEAEKQKEQSQDEGEEDGPPFYADEDSTFIPLTWSKKLPREWYKGSDPEWQSFIAIAKDPARHKRIQNELVQTVFTGTQQHPQIARQLGANAKVGKYWLDISFPDGPPQEYERSGIEIGDGYIAWSQQKISAERQRRLMRALWPTAAASSSWATLKVLVGIQYRRAKQALGFEGPDPMAVEERWRAAMEMMGKREEQKNEQREGGVSKTQTEPPGNSVVSRTSSETTQASDNNSSAKPTPPSSSSPWSVPLPNVSLPTSPAIDQTAHTDIPIAMHVFQKHLSKSWNPKGKIEPPRGTFVVQGLVEVRGERGRFLFDVQSAYDPRTAKYVQVHAGVRGYKRWKQGPRGGP